MAFHCDIDGLSAFLPLDFARSDAILNRAYVQAEMAADAIVIEHGPSLLLIPVDGLMGGVIAGDIASSAADAFFMVEFRQDFEIPVQVFGRNDIAQRDSDEIVDLLISSFIHEVA